MRSVVARRQNFARRGIGMIHHEIVGPVRRPERNGRKIGGRRIGRPAAMLRPRNELDDFCAHDNPSHNTMTTRPVSASEIRYAVIGCLSFENKSAA
jgi:hypothetical protein